MQEYHFRLHKAQTAIDLCKQFGRGEARLPAQLATPNKALFDMTPTLGGAAPLQNSRWSQLWVELELSDEGVWLGGCPQLQKR